MLSAILRRAAPTLLLLCATPAAADVVITPRFTGYFDNSNQRQSNVTSVTNGGLSQADLDDLNAQLRANFGPTASTSFSDADGSVRAPQVFFPMLGGSISFNLDSERRTQITATALYGTAKASLNGLTTASQTTSLLGFTANDIFTVRSDGRGRFKRLDLELTAQRRLNETFSLIGGLRYERLNERVAINNVTTATQNASNLIAALGGGGSISFGLLNDTSTIRYKTNSKIYSVRFGGAAYVPVGQRQQIYVNGLAHFNYAPKDVINQTSVSAALGTTTSRQVIRAETTIGPDISVGYIQQLGERVSVDLRYRGLFYFPVSGDKSFDDPRVNHGVSVGLSIRL